MCPRLGASAPNSHAKFNFTTEPVTERPVGRHPGVNDFDSGQLTVFVSTEVDVVVISNHAKVCVCCARVDNTLSWKSTLN